MKLKLIIRAKGKRISFNHQSKLSGTIYKWIGFTPEHGSASLYSFSWLQGAIKQQDGLFFPDYALLFFNSYKDSLANQLISGIKKDPAMFDGLVCDQIEILNQYVADQSVFLPQSPILVKYYDKNESHHLTFHDPCVNYFMKSIIFRKLLIAGIQPEEFSISFISNHPEATTKLVKYRDISMRANWCPVSIHCSDMIKQFILNVGVGHSTGIGFGMIH